MGNFLPLGVRTILAKTGWTENEIVVYSTLLSRGAMDLSTLSHETSTGISTIQYALKTLITKKMVQKMLLNNKPIYSITDLVNLRKWLKGYLKQYLAFEDTIQKFIDQYDFNSQMFFSRVRFFEGYRGVKQSYRTMLKECKNKEILGFFAVIEEAGKELQNFLVQEYIPGRVKRGILIKDIALESPRALEYYKNDAVELRETKIVSKALFPTINLELNLYDDCLHCMSYNDKSAFALIIEDPSLVGDLKVLFYAIWGKLSAA